MIQKILTFILVNRRNKVFRDWIPAQIVHHIRKHLSAGTIYVTMNGEQVAGIVTFTPDLDSKRVEVNDILNSTPNRKSIRGFAKRFIAQYGTGWTLFGNYYKGYREFNLDQLARIA